MGWQSQRGTDALDLRKQPGVPFEGTLVGHRKIKNSVGEQIIWSFMGPDGALQDVFGLTAMNDILLSAKQGDRFRLTFKGKVQIKGGKSFNDVDVQKYVPDNGEGASATAPAAQVMPGKIPF